jgi:fumarate reductase flavoprotein subunit
MEQVRASSVELMEEHRALALIPNRGSDALAAVLMADMRSGEFSLLRAKAILLATGGGPTMYRYHTPSGDKSMDGLAMALRLGLSLRDMEMVQFHPTGLLAGRDTRMTGTVLEEGLRGAGGYLLNGGGERFMSNYDAAGERATRDIVSRAIYAEMRKGNTSPNGGVYISMSHLGPEKVAQQFPGMVKRCADCGFDLAAGRVEVVPTAHYFMGGVVVDVDTRSALPGLYVAGEDAGGAHGANRLGGNGVANSTVYGGIAGEIMAGDVTKQQSWQEPDTSLVEREIDRALLPFTQQAGDINSIRNRLMDVMWEQVGVLRTGEELEKGLRQLNDLKQDLLGTGLANHSRVFNLSWHDWLNLQSLIEISEVIASAALARENSRGAHYREDFVDTGSLEDSYFTVVSLEKDQIEVDRQPVIFSIVKPGESLLEDDPLVVSSGAGRSQ